MMVTRWGLSDELGTVAYGENQDEVFLGYQVSRQQNISEATAQKIDAEVRRLVEAGYAEATQILTDKRADLESLAKGLLEFETLTGDEIKDLLAGKRPVRESVIEPATPRSSAVPPAGKPRPRPDAADRRGRAAAAGLTAFTNDARRMAGVMSGLRRPAFALAACRHGRFDMPHPKQPLWIARGFRHGPSARPPVPPGLWRSASPSAPPRRARAFRCSRAWR